MRVGLRLSLGFGSRASEAAGEPAPAFIQNGTFDSPNTAWTLTNDFTIADGLLKCAGASGIKRCIQISGVELVVGRTYRCEINLVRRSAGSITVGLGFEATGVTGGTQSGMTDAVTSDATTPGVKRADITIGSLAGQYIKLQGAHLANWDADNFTITDITP